MNTITLTIPAELADDIKKQIEAFEPWPQKWNMYWWVSNGGDVCDSMWNNDVTDRHRRDYGNVFRTKEEAESVANRRKSQAKIDNYIREQGIENGFIAMASNFYPYYTHSRREINTCSASVAEAGEIFYVRTKEIAQQIIDAVGEETIEMAIRGRVG